MRFKILTIAASVVLAAAAAIAQPAPAAKPKTNAEAAALYKDIKSLGEAAPDPKRPAGGNTNTSHPVENYVPVTDAALRDPKPADWIMMRGNYQGWGYSKLDQVGKGNVKNLQMVWSRLMNAGTNKSTPIVYDGVMFLANPNDLVQAIDAANGEVLWQYRRRLPSTDEMHLGMWGVHPRGIALYDNKVFTTTRDNYLVALDAKTGNELWQVNRGGDYYVTNATAPLVINGIVIAASQCQAAPMGCYVDAHDAQTGKLLWRNEFIPRPGEPGDETWAKKPFNERWQTDVWGAMTYDPESDLLYYGSSAIAPASEAQRNQIGATLAGTDTRWAVNPKTGKIAWRHQVLPGDNWDQDCTFEMLPITTAVHPDPKGEKMFAVGRGAESASRKTLTGMPCKTGIMWSFDALTGQYLWSRSTVTQNLVAGVDGMGKVAVNQDMPMRDINKTYHICPGYNGGREWTFSAYSPLTNNIYFQLQNLCSDVKVRTDNIPSLPSNDYNTNNRGMIADGHTNIGRIEAINVETGKTSWSWESRASNYSPMLTTAGGLVFNGGADRYFRAHDQVDGKILWQSRLGAAVTAAPVSYSVKGRQYIAVASGGGSMGGGAALTPGLDMPSGNNMLYVFALPE